MKKSMNIQPITFDDLQKQKEAHYIMMRLKERLEFLDKLPDELFEEFNRKQTKELRDG